MTTTLRRGLLAAALTLAATTAACDDPTTIDPAAPRTVRIDALPDTVGVGDTLTVATRVLDGAGRVMDGADASIVSLTPAILEVSATTGLVRALAPGQARVRATSGGLHVERTVTVARLARSLVVDAPDTVVVGATFTATAQARDGSGASVNDRVRWSSSDTLVLRVDSLTGTATVVGDGDALLVAHADGVLQATMVRAWLPRLDTGGFNMSQLAIGDGFACGFSFGGVVACFGSNHGGTLGRGTVSDEVLPIGQIASSQGFSFLAAGGRTACATQQLASFVYCWGEDVPGGPTGTPRAFAYPRPANSFVSRFAMGFDGTGCATTSVSASGGGTIERSLVTCWGRSTGGLLGGRTELSAADTIFGSSVYAIDLAIGTGHACARASTSGASGYGIWCWGAEMQNFTAIDTGTALTPVLVPNVAASLASSPGAIFVTRYGTCVLTGAGRPLCWGRDGGYGELPGATPGPAPGVPGPYMAPRLAPGNLTFVALHTSPTAVCGRTSFDGDVWCWGKVGRAQSTRDGVPIRVSRRQPFQNFFLGDTGYCGSRTTASVREYFCQ